MGNLINNKNQLNKFNIGFEFEFNVLKKSLIKEEKIPPEVLKKYGHLISLKNLENYKKAGNYFLKKINEAYPETNWNECFVMTAESNLGAKKTHIPVEMIFKHEIGSDAIEKLKKIIIVLNSPDFLTNDKCGLHTNISFVDDKKNRENLVFDVNETLDKDKVLINFNRINNIYCIDNNKTKTDISDLSYSISDVIENLIKIETKNTNAINVEYKVLKNLTKNLKKKNEFDKFMAMIQSVIEEKFIQDWESNRPAIAPKVYNNKNYLEFRIMGGENYQTKYAQIENGINDFLNSMNKADLLYNKKTLKTIKI